MKLAILVVLLGAATLIDFTHGQIPIQKALGYKESLELECESGIFCLVPPKPEASAPPKKEEKKEEATSSDCSSVEGGIKIENKEGKYKIENNKLTIEDLRGEEIKGKIFCNEKQFTFEGVKPFLYKPEKLSITETSGGDAKLKCLMLYGTDELKWSWKKNGTEVSGDRFNITSNDNSTLLVIKAVTDEDGGDYECVLSNKFGEHKEQIQLRVKSALAALWPFLGICAEVLILCIIILGYETRCGKKKSVPEEDNEQAQNLMGREGAGASDLKKRTAKA